MAYMSATTAKLACYLAGNLSGFGSLCDTLFSGVMQIVNMPEMLVVKGSPTFLIAGIVSQIQSGLGRWYGFGESNQLNGGVGVASPFAKRLRRSQENRVNGEQLDSKRIDQRTNGLSILSIRTLANPVADSINHLFSSYLSRLAACSEEPKIYLEARSVSI